MNTVEARLEPERSDVACTDRVLLPCSHSIGNRLSKKLALFTMLVVGVLSWASWTAVSMLLRERNAQELAVRCDLIADIVALEARNGGAPAVQSWLRADAPMRAHAHLEVRHADGTMLYADPQPPGLATSKHLRAHEFAVATPTLPGGELRARLTMDFTRDAQMGRRWAAVLVLVTLAAGALVMAGSAWHVRRALRPVRELAAQTRAISPQRLHQRLTLDDPAEELLPWVDQFNALMQRVEQAYAQLEAFNADVAHELRTPLATLIGETELALARERSNEALRATLESNLEEMQRLSSLVTDMLFLASADRGAAARRGAPASLAALARQVAEFHEAPLADAGLALAVEGDATLAVDEPLFKRALSNLLGNAIRYAEPGSTVTVRIAPPPADGAARMVVENRGATIAPAQLPRLFDRFYRGDESRCCPTEQHHGLGLAIVAAIARMHGGQPLAESEHGTTRVGFTVAAG